MFGFLFKKRRQHIKIIRDAIDLLSGKSTEALYQDCVDFLEHNEPQLALDIVLDQFLENEWEISDSGFETLQAAWELLDMPEKDLKLILRELPQDDIETK